MNGGHTNSALVVRTQSGKTLQFGGSTFLTSNLNNKIDEIIQELYRRNPRILLGYEFNKQTLYKSEVSRIRKGGAGASVLPSTPVPYHPDIGSVNDPIIASETDIRPVNDPNITSSTTEPIQTTTTVSFLPQGTAEFIQCWHCKRNNPLGVHFCTFCSQPLTMDAAAAVESAQKPSFSKQAYDTANSGFTYKKLKIVIIVASALLILLAGVIMTLGKFFSGLPTQQELVPCTFVIQEIDYREEYYIADIAREAEDVLCIMKVTITNNNSVPVQIKANQLQVIIGNDTYHANKYLSEKFTYVLSDVYKNELSSGASATAYCVFDIPDSFKYSKDLAVSYEYSDDEIDG